MNPQTPSSQMSPELTQAIQSRAQTGAPTPALAQTQQGAPAPMPPQGSPAGVPQSQAVPGASQSPVMPAQAPQPGSTEEEIITKALIQRQKQLGEFKKTTPQPTLQQMPVS